MVGTPYCPGPINNAPLALGSLTLVRKEWGIPVGLLAIFSLSKASY